MTSRRKIEACRICGGDLQGNQRRWLFSAQNKKGAQNQSSSVLLSPTWSAQSSPWGSTLSLGSSSSPYKSYTLPTPNKGLDLLAVLTHILGQSVTRENGKGEFICGKCVSVLERVFKFDTVIARVRVLSRERLQKLTKERDCLRRWVWNIYRQHHPFVLKSRGSSSEDEVELGEKDSGKAYREMLSDNMALAAYECWSEKTESCPYFKRTGKRCGKLKNCECCDSLRVSDANYEFICGVPRNLPEQALSPIGMPLNWPRSPSMRSSPASLAGSCHSLKARSRTASAPSLDSVDGYDPFDWPDEHFVILDSILDKLKSIEGKPVRSPAGSRIPILAKGQNSCGADGLPSIGVTRVLNFVQRDERDKEDVNGESDDVLTELRDDFMPLHKEVTTNKVHFVVKQLREQLDEAQARIRTLEAGLQNSNLSVPSKTSQSKQSLPEYPKSSSEDENGLIRNLSHSLQSKDRVIQECVALIRKLCLDLGSGLEEADKLISYVTVKLTSSHSDQEGVLEAELTELKERERSLQKELEVLQEANSSQERDLLTLNSVLQTNQDVINHLRVELTEKTQTLQDLQKERGLWKKRDSALEKVLQEKEALITRLQQTIESSHKDVQVLSLKKSVVINAISSGNVTPSSNDLQHSCGSQTLSDSLISRGLQGGGAEGALAQQVLEQESLLSGCLKDWESNTATTRQEVSKLCTALEEAGAVIQDQRQTHEQAITELSEQLKDSRRELREIIKDTKQAEQAWRSERVKRDFEEGRLVDCLRKRDKLIEQVLLDAEKRDGMLIELHQDILSKVEPRVGLKHTL